MDSSLQYNDLVFPDMVVLIFVSCWLYLLNFHTHFYNVVYES